MMELSDPVLAAALKEFEEAHDRQLMSVNGAVVSLICEGACNPQIVLLDREVAAARKAEMALMARAEKEEGEPRYPAISDPALLRRIRALRHTPHGKIGSSLYRCRECGTVRRCGGFE